MKPINLKKMFENDYKIETDQAFQFEANASDKELP